jgi:hypothetical protein
MSTSGQWFVTANEARLSILLRNAADLERELYELAKLRYRVRQAEWAARESRRIDDGRRKRVNEGQGHAAL